MRHSHGLRAAVSSGGSWGLGSPTYVGSFSVTSRELAPQDLYVSQTRLFIIGSDSDSIVHYSITNWDITTASFVRSQSVSTYETVPNGLFFKSDGTVAYWVGSNNDRVYQSTLSTAWNISTAGTPTNFSVTTEDTTPQGLFFSSNGLNMFMVGSGSDNVNKYTLSTAWNVTTATFSQSFSVGTQDANPGGVHFKDDGLRMYVVGRSNDAIYQYQMSTAWDLSTAWFVKSFSVAAQDTSPNGVFFRSGGNTMYVVGSANASVYAYNL